MHWFLSANRRYFNDSLEREWNRSLRDGSTLALLLIDVDYFKNYNDQNGHPAGDQVLRQVAEIIRENGYDVRAVLSPTVPKGTERIRICLHAFNTDDEVKSLVKIIEKSL